MFNGLGLDLNVTQMSVQISPLYIVPKPLGAGAPFNFKVSLLGPIINKNEIYQKYLEKITYNVCTDVFPFLIEIVNPWWYFWQDTHNSLCWSQDIYFITISVSVENDISHKYFIPKGRKILTAFVIAKEYSETTLSQDLVSCCCLNWILVEVAV